jgi:transposase-like protein
MLTCPRCQCQDTIKNGKTHYKKQNYRCKQCNRQFVADNTHTIPEQTKRFIAKALAERNSLRSICRIFSVSLNWLIKLVRQLWQQQYPLALKGGSSIGRS